MPFYFEKDDYYIPQCVIKSTDKGNLGRQRPTLIDKFFPIHSLHEITHRLCQQPLSTRALCFASNRKVEEASGQTRLGQHTIKCIWCLFTAPHNILPGLVFEVFPIFRPFLMIDALAPPLPLCQVGFRSRGWRWNVRLSCLSRRTQ